MKPSELLASPSSWSRGELARGPDGKRLDWYDPNACSWCVLGALYKCFGDRPERFGNYAERHALRDVIGGGSIQQWNDDPETTHADVLATLRKAGL